jgi:hypothetical protein
MKLALGPLLYLLAETRGLRVLRRDGAEPGDRHHLRRRGRLLAPAADTRAADWLALARDLTDAGKEVVVSAQALLESENDLKSLRRLADQLGEIPGCRLEANDLGAVNIAAGRPFVAGAASQHLQRGDAGHLCPLRHAAAGCRRWKATAG